MKRMQKKRKCGLSKYMQGKLKHEKQKQKTLYQIWWVIGGGALLLIYIFFFLPDLSFILFLEDIFG